MIHVCDGEKFRGHMCLRHFAAMLARARAYYRISDSDVGLKEGSYWMELFGTYVKYTPFGCIDYTPITDCVTYFTLRGNDDV